MAKKKADGIRERKRRLRVESAEIGKRLFELRTERKVSQMDLANKLGVVRNAYGAWEKDETEPSLGQIELVALLLGSTPEYIAFGLGEKHARRNADERRARYSRRVVHNGLEDLKGLKPLPMSLHVLTREGLLGEYQERIDQSLDTR